MGFHRNKSNKERNSQAYPDRTRARQRSKRRSFVGSGTLVSGSKIIWLGLIACLPCLHICTVPNMVAPPKVKSISVKQHKILQGVFKGIKNMKETLF